MNQNNSINRFAVQSFMLNQPNILETELSGYYNSSIEILNMYIVDNDLCIDYIIKHVLNPYIWTISDYIKYKREYEILDILK